MSYPAAFKGYDFDRMAVLFTITHKLRHFPCTISMSTLDDLEEGGPTWSESRESQFTKLTPVILASARRKLRDEALEGTPPTICLRRSDFKARGSGERLAETSVPHRH